ncbi:hypothetical protein Mal33_04660 [Rosistilla oblonga]|uniref:Uncharacterized protein n=1 Tax=Rosistilla oblonga TaxID=2527990 RepID=A0A518IN64_9BACT|nr:hypothetical protein Mal33_04660 [Rosistilla oblonga]
MERGTKCGEEEGDTQKMLAIGSKKEQEGDTHKMLPITFEELLSAAKGLSVIRKSW